MPSSMAIASRKAKRMANRLLDSQVSVPEAIARVLEQAGIEFVFGMPGGRTGSIYQALYDHRAPSGACWCAKRVWLRSWPTCTDV